MTKQISYLLITLTFCLNNCTFENRFAKKSVAYAFSFSLFGYEGYECIKKYRPLGITYNNGISPNRVCTSYEIYKCNINHYCNNDSQCEKDAKEYWLRSWVDKDGNKIDSVSTTKTYCERIKQQCDNASKGDQTCRK